MRVLVGEQRECVSVSVSSLLFWQEKWAWMERREARIRREKEMGSLWSGL